MGIWLAHGAAGGLLVVECMYWAWPGLVESRMRGKFSCMVDVYEWHVQSMVPKYPSIVQLVKIFNVVAQPLCSMHV